MTGADDLFNMLGRLGGAALPEVLKDAVQGVEGFEFLAEPVRRAMAGLGELAAAYGPEIAKTLGELGDSAKDLWDLGGGADIVEQTLRQLQPPKGA